MVPFGTDRALGDQPQISHNACCGFTLHSDFEPLSTRLPSEATTRMNQLFKPIASTLFIAALAACGGGGDDSTATNPGTAPTTVPTKYTQADVQNITSLGLAAIAGGNNRAGRVAFHLSSYLINFSTTTGGSVTANNQSCVVSGAGSGTYSYSVTKSANRMGLASGDQVSMTFSRCDYGGNGFIDDGSVTLTARSAIANASPGIFDVSFDANLIDYELPGGFTKTKYSGLINAAVNKASANSVITSFTVAPAQTFTQTTGDVWVAYAAGTTGTVTQISSPNNISYKLEGQADVHALEGSTRTLLIATPTPLAGPIVAGQLSPASGVINVKDTTRNITTSTTFSGPAASLSGDTDGNGSLDLVFNSSWAKLINP